jgi:site-specific DNA recombinase
MLQSNSSKSNHSVRAALYARVSTEQQATAGTIQSQIDAVLARAAEDGRAIETELRYIDDGVSGATLVRAALEKLRDAAAAGAIDVLYVLCPDRLSRQYAHQMLLIDELGRCGVAVVFVNHPLGSTPEDNLLLQVQSMIGEYERSKILERCRRGKLHGARAGKLSVLGHAPYGYRYLPAQGGCPAQYNVHLPEAAVVRQIFNGVALQQMSLWRVCRTLEKQGVLSPSGMTRWNASSVKGILDNPAYKGAAAYGRTCRGPMRHRLRPVRGSSGIPRGAKSVYPTPAPQWISIAVPAIIEESLFDQAAVQLAANRKRYRQRHGGACALLQGLLVCGGCGYACHGSRSGAGTAGKHNYYRFTCRPPADCARSLLCDHRSIRQNLLDEIVWNDVRQFLADPARVAAELQRRLAGEHTEAPDQIKKQLDGQVSKVRRGIARLIDAYEQGLVDKPEFEPRIKAARRQLGELEQQLKQQVDQQARAREMKLVIDNLQSFSEQVMSGLDQADWQTRRQIITTLIKQVELEKEQVKIVYRVDLCPFDRRPKRGDLQHCTARQLVTNVTCSARAPSENIKKWCALGRGGARGRFWGRGRAEVTGAATVARQRNCRARRCAVSRDCCRGRAVEGWRSWRWVARQRRAG